MASWQLFGRGALSVLTQKFTAALQSGVDCWHRIMCNMLSCSGWWSARVTDQQVHLRSLRSPPVQQHPGKAAFSEKSVHNEAKTTMSQDE